VITSDAPDRGLLTAEESEALFAAMRDGRLAAVDAAPASLGAADAPLVRALPGAEGANKVLAGALRDALFRLVQGAGEIDPKPPEVAQNLADLPDAVSWRLVSAGEIVGAITLGPELARLMLDRRLGTSDQMRPAAQRDVRPISLLDRRMLEPLALVLAEAASARTGTPLAVGPPAAPPSPALRFTFTAKIGLVTDDVTIALGPAALRGGAAAPPVVERGHVARNIADVEVDMVAVLGRIPASVRELLALEEGAVLRLGPSPEDPLPVLVDDFLVARGAPCVHHGQLALRVTEHFPRKAVRE